MTSEVHRFAHEAMATTFEVMIAGHPHEYARQVSAQVFLELDHLEGLLSRFDPRSDIAQICRLEPGHSVRVSYEVMECLLFAREVSRETGGAFDVTFRTARHRDPDAEEAYSESAMNELIFFNAAGGEEPVSPVELAVGRRPLAPGMLPHHVQIDLGAVGKGYALDRVTEILDDWGVESALLNAGTSTVLALAPPPGEEGWLVGVGGIWGDQLGIDSVLLAHGALSGSGTELQGEHVADPRNGAPPLYHRAAWAKCASAGRSDALSTAFMVMSTGDVEAYSAMHPKVGAIVVPRDPQFPPRRFGAW